MCKTPKLLLMLMAALLLLSLASCTMKEGILVQIEKKDNTFANTPNNTFSTPFDVIPQKALIENNSKILKGINTDLTPLAISPDNSLVFVYETIKSPEVEAENSRVITGNLKQEILLYTITVETKEKKLVGRFLNIKDLKFNNTGRMLAFLDADNSVYIYDLTTEQLELIMKANKHTTYRQVSWSKDSKSIMIDTNSNIDIASKELISYVVDKPYIKHSLNYNDYYIVQMKNAEYKDIIAIYDFESRDYMNLANGIYLDSDGKNIIYTNDDMTVLEIVELKTREDKSIEHGPIYSAYVLKSTGEILYTTLSEQLNAANRYELIKFNPETGDKTIQAVSSPTFYLSPAEDKLYFICNFWENSFTVDLLSFATSSIFNKTEDKDLEDIKTVIIKMFDLDYNFKGDYEEYIDEAREIYTNVSEPIPQEALENKLIDFKRFNAPLPSNQKEASKPHTLILNTLNINRDRASLSLGLFYVNSIEMVKVDNKWFIAGFSTHPDSKEIIEIRSVVQKHLNDIINGNRKEALEYWDTEQETDFVKSQIKIIDDFIANNDKYTYEIGEIELWNKNEPHRVQKADAATGARVKIIIKNQNNTVKYKLTLIKSQKNSFEINSWSADPLSISQYF